MRRTVVLLILMAALLACRRAETPAPQPRPAQPAPESKSATTNVGDAMPPYTAKGLDGAPFDLAAEKGSVVLVNVWATWCGPCRFEVPELQKLHDHYSGRGFRVVGVSVDEGDAAGVKQFVAEQKMTYPVAVDPDGRIANLLQTMVLPTSVLIDRSGKIVWRQVGALSPGDAKLTAAIEAALGAPHPPSGHLLPASGEKDPRHSLPRRVRGPKPLCGGRASRARVRAGRAGAR